MKVDLNEFLVIGDIAGRYDELIFLINKAPKNIPIVCVGDPNDRGKDSKKVIEFFMQPNRFLVQSNHAHMLIDYVDGNGTYEESIFEMNGGLRTLQSYGVENKTFIPKEHIDFLKSCPMYIETEKCIITHAPINPTLPLVESLDFSVKNCYGKDVEFIWNRGGVRRRDKFQFHGHNALKNIEFYKDEKGIYGANIDTSRAEKLTGIIYPSMLIIEQEYLSDFKKEITQSI